MIDRPADGVRQVGDQDHRSSATGGGLKACATFVAALTVAACATTKPPALPAPPGAPAAEVRLKPDATTAEVTTADVRVKPDAATDRLHRDIDAILSEPQLAHGYWGVLVRSLKTGETLYAV